MSMNAGMPGGKKRTLDTLEPELASCCKLYDMGLRNKTQVL